MWRYRTLPQILQHYLTTQDGDRKDKSITDTSPTIGCISYTLTTSTSITDFTSKTILKELDALAITNCRVLKLKPTVLKSTVKHSTGNASQSANPAVAAAADTTTTQAGVRYALATNSSNTPLHINIHSGILDIYWALDTRCQHLKC